ncbi:hypothetical protein ONZ45_g9800 [Pleurotus djamor]|nr:hypothetical protein ONZ45_g9800 [Pleurotus djamor]
MVIRTNFEAQSLIDVEIETEMRRHEETMKALKVRRNQHCAINQLPNEVLTSIFLALERQAHFSPDLVVFERWNALLLVSQAWHDLIINNPCFWSSIHLNSAQPSRFLRLSKDSLLHLSFDLHNSVSERLWKLVLDTISQSSRLQALWMDFSVPASFSRVMDMIPPASSAPHLQQLTIRVSDRGMGEFDGNIWTDLPSLRELNIYGGPLLSTNIHSMPQLTHLMISTDLPGHQATASWLLGAFRSSPNLEDVHVRDLHGPLIDPRSPRVSLASLHTLSITSRDSSTLSIFNHLDVPSLTILSVRYTKARANVFTLVDLSGLRSTMSGVLTPPKTIHTVDLSMLANEFIFRVYVRPNHPDDKLLDRSIQCSLPIVPPADMPNLLQVCDLPQLHKASTLIIQQLDARRIGPGPLSFIPWCTDVETIVFNDCNPRLLEALLKPDVDHHPPNPKLTRLCFEFTDFRTTEGKANPMFHLLIRIIRERAYHMMPIQKVMIYRCDLRISFVEKLDSLVEVVYGEWNG